ncbi:hypothetical protein LCGC14_2634510 [marine sediment metagenome]|uniref:Peptidase S11 D-alanyl-D-alanine carboxypeptidase A N-terminal domain-containing protein n=1 Tax=marine sediment metagenome TaxID=412755 RepID=A0A0F9CRP7_9ZZZZ
MPPEADSEACCRSCLPLAGWSAAIARRDRAILKFPIKGGRLFLYNNNPLIRSDYRGVTGLKTGYTRKAGRSLVATAKRGRVKLGVVLLHSYNPAEQTRKLLDRGFKTMRARR